MLFTSVSESQAATSGLVYRISKLKPLPAGKQAAAVASCPQDTSVVGGGLEIGESNTATGMQSSYPVDGGDADATPDDGWRAVANSRSAGDKSLLAFAVCSKTGQYRYVARLKEPVANNSRAQVDAPCPPGRSLAGGGVKLSYGGASTLYTVGATLPFDTTADGTPDAWRAVANNQSGINQDLTAYAICARTGSYRYANVKVNAPPGAQTERRTPCPRQASVTAGGVAARTSDLRPEVAASLPFDGDGDMVLGDRWLGAINNNGTAPVELRVYAICRKHT